MGIFDFLKKQRKSVPKGGDEAQVIKKLLDLNLRERIRNLKVEFDNGIVTLSGYCDSQATKEKAIILARKVKTVKEVNVKDLLTEPVTKPVEEEAEFYTVQAGDSLSKIAKKFYGDANKYPLIFEANKDIIKDPNLIHPGQKLRIPELE